VRGEWAGGRGLQMIGTAAYPEMPNLEELWPGICRPEPPYDTYVRFLTLTTISTTFRMLMGGVRLHLVT
jgi:hypothetical protein